MELHILLLHIPQELHCPAQASLLVEKLDWRRELIKSQT
jgi:hypothetical protein